METQHAYGPGSRGSRPQVGGTESARTGFDLRPASDCSVQDVDKYQKNPGVENPDHVGSDVSDRVENADHACSDASKTVAPGLSLEEDCQEQVDRLPPEHSSEILPPAPIGTKLNEEQRCPQHDETVSSKNCTSICRNLPNGHGSALNDKSAPKRSSENDKDASSSRAKSSSNEKIKSNAKSDLFLDKWVPVTAASWMGIGNNAAIHQNLLPPSAKVKRKPGRPKKVELKVKTKKLLPRPAVIIQDYAQTFTQPPVAPVWLQPVQPPSPPPKDSEQPLGSGGHSSPRADPHQDNGEDSEGNSDQTEKDSPTRKQQLKQQRQKKRSLATAAHQWKGMGYFYPGFSYAHMAPFPQQQVFPSNVRPQYPHFYPHLPPGHHSPQYQLPIPYMPPPLPQHSHATQPVPQSGQKGLTQQFHPPPPPILHSPSAQAVAPVPPEIPVIFQLQQVTQFFAQLVPNLCKICQATAIQLAPSYYQSVFFEKGKINIDDTEEQQACKKKRKRTDHYSLEDLVGRDQRGVMVLAPREFMRKKLRQSVVHHLGGGNEGRATVALKEHVYYVAADGDPSSDQKQCKGGKRKRPVIYVSWKAFERTGRHAIDIELHAKDGIRLRELKKRKVHLQDMLKERDAEIRHLKDELAAKDKKIEKLKRHYAAGNCKDKVLSEIFEDQFFTDLPKDVLATEGQDKNKISVLKSSLDRHFDFSSMMPLQDPVVRQVEVPKGKTNFHDKFCYNKKEAGDRENKVSKSPQKPPKPTPPLSQHEKIDKQKCNVAIDHLKRPHVSNGIVVFEACPASGAQPRLGGKAPTETYSSQQGMGILDDQGHTPRQILSPYQGSVYTQEQGLMFSDASLHSHHRQGLMVLNTIPEISSYTQQQLHGLPEAQAYDNKQVPSLPNLSLQLQQGSSEQETSLANVSISVSEDEVGQNMALQPDIEQHHLGEHDLQQHETEHHQVEHHEMDQQLDHQQLDAQQRLVGPHFHHAIHHHPEACNLEQQQMVRRQHLDLGTQHAERHHLVSHQHLLGLHSDHFLFSQQHVGQHCSQQHLDLQHTGRQLLGFHHMARQQMGHEPQSGFEQQHVGRPHVEQLPGSRHHMTHQQLSQHYLTHQQLENQFNDQSVDLGHFPLRSSAGASMVDALDDDMPVRYCEGDIGQTSALNDLNRQYQMRIGHGRESPGLTLQPLRQENEFPSISGRIPGVHGANSLIEMHLAKEYAGQPTSTMTYAMPSLDVSRQTLGLNGVTMRSNHGLIGQASNDITELSLHLRESRSRHDKLRL